MKLLIADTLPPSHVESLRKIVGEVEYDPDLTEDSLVDRIKGARILVVRGTRVRAQAIEAGEDLELIVRAGAGTENIDMAAASAKGIYVTNCPDKNAAAVAELTLGLLLAVDRRIPEQNAALQERKWNKSVFQHADGLKGKAFGVVGVGSIGREVIKRAKSFGMHVVAWSRSLTDQKAAELGISRASSVDELIEKCDIISLHVALTPETKHLISAKRIARMKQGTIILNTARGAVIDNVGLAEALKNGRIRAGLDVYETEPKEGQGSFVDVLAGVPNWVGTHHVGASTMQAQRATADETVRLIEHYLMTGDVENCVNFAQETSALYELVIRHYDRIGVLTRILMDLRESRISVHEVHNVMFEGANAAVAHIQIDTYPTNQVIQSISSRKTEIISVRIVKLQPTSSEAQIN
ncbi:MAG: hydroxyacid dehydrogenase [Candidatus Bathyarchaeia archaeon]